MPYVPALSSLLLLAISLKAGNKKAGFKGSKVQGSRFSGSLLRPWGFAGQAGYKVHGSGFWVQGSRFRGSLLRPLGLGLRSLGFACSYDPTGRATSPQVAFNYARQVAAIGYSSNFVLWSCKFIESIKFAEVLKYLFRFWLISEMVLNKLALYNIIIKN